MRNFIFIIILGCLYTSCSFILSESENDLKSRKQTIDTEISSGNISAHSVAAVNKGQDIDYFYQLFQNETNNLLMASETHLLNNNPSDTIFTYYFDEYENTFAVQVKIVIDSDSLFNSVTAFYNRNMEIIMKEYAIIDNCNLALGEANDSLYIDFTKFQVPTDVKSFVKEKNIFLRSK